MSLCVNAGLSASGKHASRTTAGANFRNSLEQRQIRGSIRSCPPTVLALSPPARPLMPRTGCFPGHFGAGNQVRDVSAEALCAEFHKPFPRRPSYGEGCQAEGCECCDAAGQGGWLILSCPNRQEGCGPDARSGAVQGREHGSRARSADRRTAAAASRPVNPAPRRPASREPGPEARIFAQKPRATSRGGQDVDQ